MSAALPCPECGCVFDRKAKFCSTPCQRRFNAKRRYAEREDVRKAALERARTQREARTKETKRLYRQAQRQRLAAAGLSQSRRLLKHDGHVTAWRNAQPERVEPYSAHVSCWRASCEAAYRRHLYRTKPATNVRQRLRARLRKLIPGGRLAARFSTEAKAGRWPAAWTEQFGYTLADLLARLAETMPKGYGWGDFLAGDLHIDHITPRCTFDCSQPDQLRACWALSNLQLLTAEANRRKGARLAHEFHGSLFDPPHQGNSNVGSSRVDLQACKLEYSIVSPK